MDARDWFKHRSYEYKRYSDLQALGRRKQERGLTVSAVLPSRNVADTVGHIIDEIHAVNERASDNPLVDQILVVDADSPDGTAAVAGERGAEVFSENELMRDHGGAHGKGDAMWRSLSVARGDLIMFMDADTRDFEPQLVYGILGPILEDPQIRYVKAAYRRPFKNQETVQVDGGGRVTELSTKPLFNLFYPDLTGFVQPLAGEFVADRDLFRSIPFLTGYAVETGIMIDAYKKVGLEAMAQVDLGTRQNRHQPLRDLSRMSYAVLRAVARRMRQEGRLNQTSDPDAPVAPFQLSDYLHAVATPEGLQLQEYVEELVERPPIEEVLRVR
jgi:glucosyl-3-phosphoglycerate synthase